MTIRQTQSGAIYIDDVATSTTPDQTPLAAEIDRLREENRQLRRLVDRGTPISGYEKRLSVANDLLRTELTAAKRDAKRSKENCLDYAERIRYILRHFNCEEFTFPDGDCWGVTIDAGAKRDAKWYQWLRTNANVSVKTWAEWQSLPCTHFDAAIDSAMKEKP